MLRVKIHGSDRHTSLETGIYKVSFLLCTWRRDATASLETVVVVAIIIIKILIMMPIITIIKTVQIPMTG